MLSFRLKLLHLRPAPDSCWRACVWQVSMVCLKQKTGFTQVRTVWANWWAYLCMLAGESYVLVSPGEGLGARLHSNFPILRVCVGLCVHTFM